MGRTVGPTAMKRLTALRERLVQRLEEHIAKGSSEAIFEHHAELEREMTARGLEPVGVGTLNDRVGHLIDAVRQTRDVAGTLRGHASSPEGKAALAAFEPRLRRVREIAEALRPATIAQTVAEHVAAGADPAAAAFEVTRQIREKFGGWSIADEMPDPAVREGSTYLSAFGAGELHRALVRGIERAQQKMWRETPRAEREVRYINPQGKTVKRIPIVQERDEFLDFWTSRVLSRLGMTGGEVTLSPNLKIRAQVWIARKALYYKHVHEAIEAALGEEGMKYARQGMPGELQVAAWLRGKKNSLPGWMVPHAEGMRRVLDGMYQPEVQ